MVETCDVRRLDDILWMSTCVSVSFHIKLCEKNVIFTNDERPRVCKRRRAGRMLYTVSHFWDPGENDITINPSFSSTVKNPATL